MRDQAEEMSADSLFDKTDERVDALVDSWTTESDREKLKQALQLARQLARELASAICSGKAIVASWSAALACLDEMVSRLERSTAAIQNNDAVIERCARRIAPSAIAAADIAQVLPLQPQPEIVTTTTHAFSQHPDSAPVKNSGRVEEVLRKFGGSVAMADEVVRLERELAAIKMLRALKEQP